MSASKPSLRPSGNDPEGIGEKVKGMKYTLSMLLVVFWGGVTLPPASGFAQSIGGATTGPVAGPSRPHNVPYGYLITPFGYFHPSCVQKLAKGERLLTDGRVQHADGTVDVNVAVCNYPRYTATGLPVNGGAAIVPQIDGWVENANITTGSATESYGALIATWTVPPQPTGQDDEVLFFFPGFEDINDYQTSILQPVLQWAPREWTIASWNCCLNGITVESPPVNVRSGDVIYGSITSTCPAGTVSCATWNVLSLDLFTGESTTLSDTPSEGQMFNWAFGGVLEAYNIVSCADFPPNRQIVFGHVTVFDEYLHPIHDPKWTVTSVFPSDPACSYGVKADRHEVHLDY
jgi:hypothetical protein